MVGQANGARPFGFIARLTASGILDSTFSVDGYATGITLTRTELRQVYEAPDGLLVASGLSTLGTGVWMIAIAGYSPASIVGNQWHDLNANGVLDANEPMLSNATAYLDLNENGKLDNGEPVTLTDARGRYEFRNVRPGSYRVSVVADEFNAQPAQPMLLDIPAGVTVTSPVPILFKRRDGTILEIAGQLKGNNKIEVVVPPLLDVNTLSFTSGYVDVFLSTASGDVPLANDIRVGQLPSSPYAAGSVSTAFLGLARRMTVAALHQMSRIDSTLSNIDFAVATSRYQTLLKELTQGLRGMQQLLGASDAEISLGSLGGLDAKLNLRALAMADALILAYLNPSAAPNQGEGEDSGLRFLKDMGDMIINTTQSPLTDAQPHLDRLSTLFRTGAAIAVAVAATGGAASLPAALALGGIIATTIPAVTTVVTGTPAAITGRLRGNPRPEDLDPFVDYAVSTLISRVVSLARIYAPQATGALRRTFVVLDVLSNDMTNTSPSNLLRTLQRNASDIATRVGAETQRLVMIDSESSSVNSASGTTNVSGYFTDSVNGSGTIDFSVSDASEAQISPTSVSFNTPKPFELFDSIVTGIDDGDVAPTQVFVTGKVESSDAVVDGLTASLPLSNVPDLAQVVVLPPTDSNLAESGGVHFIDVLLSSPPASGNVTIPVLTTRPDKSTVSPSQLVFNQSNWDKPQRITVSAKEDDLSDGDQQLVVRLDEPQSNDPRYNALGALDVPFVHIDNDVPPGIIVEPDATLFVSEQGVSDRFRVRLATAPQGDVTLRFRSTDPTEAKVEPASFTFNATNWDQDVQVLVTGLDDTEADGDVGFTVLAELQSTTDPRYAKVASKLVKAINQDNEASPDLYIQMRFSSLTPMSGETVQTQITVGNRGRVNASQVRIDMAIIDIDNAFPANFALGGVACILSPRRTIATCNLPTLTAGQSINSSITFTPVSNAAAPSTVFVSGTIASEPYDSPETRNDNILGLQLQIQVAGRASGEDDASNKLGWRTSSPSNQSFQVETLYDGQNSGNIQFGRYRVATVSGIAFDDRDRNGRRADHEAFLLNYRIAADINQNGVYEVGEPSTLVLADGTYQLPNMTPGSYKMLLAPSNGSGDSTTIGLGSVDLKSASTVPLTVAMARANPWRNPINRYDVNSNGTVSPIDVLLVINQLNLGNWRNALPVPVPENSQDKAYVDVSNDGAVSPLDALLVINFLNARASAEGESILFNEPSTVSADVKADPQRSVTSPIQFLNWDDHLADLRKKAHRLP